MTVRLPLPSPHTSIPTPPTLAGPAVVAPGGKPSAALLRLKQEDCSEFEAILNYIMSSRLSCVTM